MKVSSAFAPIDIRCFRALRGEGTTHSDIRSPGTTTCKFTEVRLLEETGRSCVRLINWFSQRSIFINQPHTGKGSNGMVIGYFNEHQFDLGGMTTFKQTSFRKCIQGFTLTAVRARGYVSGTDRSLIELACVVKRLKKRII